MLGSYRREPAFFWQDWGRLGQAPCYRAYICGPPETTLSTCDTLVVVPQSAGYQPTVPESLGVLLGKILIPGADSRTNEFFFTIITIITAAAAASQMNKLRLKEIKSCDYRTKCYQQD